MPLSAVFFFLLCAATPLRCYVVRHAFADFTPRAHISMHADFAQRHIFCQLHVNATRCTISMQWRRVRRCRHAERHAAAAYDYMQHCVLQLLMLDTLRR